MAQDLLPALRARFGAGLQLRVLTSSPIDGLEEDEILCPAPEPVLGVSGAGIGLWRQVLEEVWETLERDPPDLFVAVSHHGFNLILAAELKALAGAKTRTLMVAPPEVWAWDVRSWLRVLRPLILWAAPRRQSLPFALGTMLNRGRSTLEIFDGIACLLEPNARAYRHRLRQRGGALVVRVGHPFARYADPALQERTREAGRALRSSLAASPGKLLVGLFPGSREAEVNHLLPVMLEAVSRLRGTHGDHLEFFVAASGERRGAQIQSFLEKHSPDETVARIPVVEGRPEAALSAADFGLLCSGTVTLQAACLGLPSIVAYRRGWSLLKTAVGHLLVRRGRVSAKRGAESMPFALPSAVLGERVFPELAMSQCTPQRVATALEELIDSGNAKARIREHQERLLRLLQPEPPSATVGTTADTPMQRVAEIGLQLVTEAAGAD